jgi:serine/threonine-protein kinase
VIEYAHNRGVLHRDLKPANIMLGKYGETLVVDWGLAKPLGATATAVLPVEEAPLRPESIDVSTATQMGRIVGTPAYMSPEQAAGRLDLVGPAADIYSLGATLYHVLTGSAPLGSEAGHDVLRRVVQGEFPAPRARRPEAPRPLEAICLKAMAREPHARYASAHALAEDVERYLADEPVQAFAEPWPLRAARWMRKHRPLVYGGAAVLVVTAAALTLGVLLLGAANRREQAQRQLAERNFALARDAVRDYYISVSEETLLDQEGMQPLRDRLLRQALDYYRTFVESEPDEPALRDELAQANFYVGSITEKIDSPAEAMPFYEQALRLYQEAELDGTDAVARREGEGKCLNALGGALQKLHRFDEALTQYERAVGVRRELLALAPGNIDYLRTLANTVMNQGTIWVQRGDDQRGIALWNEAQQLRLAQLQPQNPEHRLLLRDAGLGNFNLGLFELGLDRPAEAEQFLTEAAAAFQRVCELNPNDLDSQYRLAIAYRTLGDLQPLPDGRQRARDYYEKALELLRLLTVRNPEVPSYRAEWGAVQLTVADLLLVTDQSAEALEALDQAVETLAALVVEFPDVPLYARNWGVALRLRGDVRWQRAATDAERAAAAADLQQAAAALERLAAASPADDDFAAQRDAAVEAWNEAQRALNALDAKPPAVGPTTTTPETETPQTETPQTETPQTETPPTAEPSQETSA